MSQKQPRPFVAQPIVLSQPLQMQGMEVDKTTEYIFPQKPVTSDEEIYMKGIYTRNFSRYDIPRESYKKN